MLGHLTKEEVEDLLQMQQLERPKLGELLVQIEALQPEEVELALSRFEAERAGEQASDDEAA